MFNIDEKNKNKYKLLKDSYIDEQNLEVVELEHIKTAAKIILLVCEDENRTFNIAFKTLVDNDKGIPHILEHSVLCGSRKYNVKDPFIELAKGSMNTFLNAMTFPDKTCYPVASANLQDFHNLMDVYLDAVFYPNAIKNDKIFRQEGWHYEIEDTNKKLVVNGVVYNEMRGVYSNPDSLLEAFILKNLYEGTEYAYEYGGDPKEIINLSYDEFVKFHDKYYSPSNSFIYLYGKLDYNEELAYIASEYLDNFEKVDIKVNFSDEINDDNGKNFKTDKTQIDYYNVDTKDNDDKAYIAYTFLLNNKKTALNHIVIQIIDYVLFSSDTALLKEKLLSLGLGESVFAQCEEGIKKGFYSIISQNINENKKEEFIKTIIEYINDMISKGLDVDKFKAAINSLYFNYAESEFGKMPRGLIFSLNSLDTYLYGEDAAIFLEYKEAFDYLRGIDLSDNNNIFITTLREIFIDNKYKCINILRPKYDYQSEKNLQQEKVLSDRRAKMSEEELSNIIIDTNKLKEYQKEKDTEEALKCIPSLKISDIDKYKKLVNYKFEVNENTETIVSFENDKDIIYLNLSFDITELTKEEIYLFSLITIVVSKINMKNMSFYEFNNYVDINTGGLTLGINAYNDKVLFTYGIKVTKDKINYAFDIFYKLISETKFVDEKRILILLNKCKSDALLSLLSEGHISASIRANSKEELSCFIADKVGHSGVGFNRFINAVCKEYEKNHDLINDALDILYKKLNQKKMYLSVCTKEEYYEDIKLNYKKFYDNLISEKIKFLYSEKDEQRLKNDIKEIKKFINFDSFDKKVRKEAIITPSDINFCALSGKFDEGKYTGKLYALKTLFNYEYLWTNIRVLGGAYGCMFTFSRKGNYTFVSYRDPHVANTNKTFYGVKDFLKNVKFSNEEITKFVIGSIGVYDNPLSVVDRFKANISAFYNNLTDEKENKKRRELLELKKEDINNLSELFNDVENANMCALISADKVEDAKKEYDVVCQLMEQ